MKLSQQLCLKFVICAITQKILVSAATLVRNFSCLLQLSICLLVIFNKSLLAKSVIFEFDFSAIHNLEIEPVITISPMTGIDRKCSDNPVLSGIWNSYSAKGENSHTSGLIYNFINNNLLLEIFICEHMCITNVCVLLRILVLYKLLFENAHEKYTQVKDGHWIIWRFEYCGALGCVVR
jgi:hypothetical protein